jgi:4-hydroxyacetophenone monooxygenase
MSLVHLTGDVSILTAERRPRGGTLLVPETPLPENVQREVRRLAVDELEKYFRRGAPPLPTLRREQLDVMIRYLIGDDAPEGYLPFLEEELGVADMRRPDWSTPVQKRAAAGLSAVIIGAGMSGLLAAIRLSQAGIAFTILEMNPEVGGTWYDNTYPGCRVDSDNQLYSYSFEPNPQWPQHFSTQSELLKYFQRITQKYGLRQHIRFNSKVEEARFDEAAGCWRVRFRDALGAVQEIAANVLFSATGQLNVPRYPDITGLLTFAGPAFHSARWRHDVDLKDKRVAVIGTGASAFQFVPEIAPHVRHLEVFQRNPPWLMPTPHYQDDVSSGQQWLLEFVPFYANWYRFWLYWRTVDGMYAAMKRDPAYRGGKSINALNEQAMDLIGRWIQAQAGDDPKLAGNVIPRFPVGGKRGLRDNGAWIKALRRPNVSLITAGIAEIKPQGVLTRDGELHEADVLIYGTGFRASEFLSTYRVIGRGVVDLHSKWAGEARAYLGALVPEFPNMFMLYGPNTNLVVNGSIVLFAECSVRYALGCLQLMADKGAATVEVRPDVFERYNEGVDRENAQMAWGVPQVSSWYKSASGRVSQNWPYPTVTYWEATRQPNADDLQFA